MSMIDGGGEPDPASVGSLSGGGGVGTAGEQEVLLTFKVEITDAISKITSLKGSIDALSTSLKAVTGETDRAMRGLAGLGQRWNDLKSTNWGVGGAMVGAQAGMGIMGAAAQRYSPSGPIATSFQAYENAAQGYVLQGMGGPNGGASTFGNVIGGMSQQWGVGGFGAMDTSAAVMGINRQMGMGGAGVLLGNNGGATVAAQLTGTSLSEAGGTAAGMYSAGIINNLQRMGGIMVQPGGQRRPFQDIAVDVLKRAANGRQVTSTMMEVLAPGSDMYVNLMDMLGGDQNLVEQVIAIGRANIKQTGGMDQVGNFSQQALADMGVVGPLTGTTRNAGAQNASRMGKEYNDNVGAAQAVVEMQTNMENFNSEMARAIPALTQLAASGGVLLGNFGGLAVGAMTAAQALMTLSGNRQLGAVTPPGASQNGKGGFGMSRGMTAVGIAGMAATMALPALASALAPVFSDDPDTQQKIAGIGSVAGSTIGGAMMGASIGSAIPGLGTGVGAAIGGGLGFVGGGGIQLVGSILGDAVLGTTGGSVNLQGGAAQSNSLQAGAGNAAEARAYVVARSDNKSSMAAGKVPDYFIIKLAKLLQAYPNLRVGGGWRSNAEQKQLWIDHQCDRPQGCTIATARPGRSNHEVGLAVDLNTNTVPWPTAAAGNPKVAPFGLHLPVSSENWHIQPTEVKSGAQSPEGLATLNGKGLDATGGTGLGSGNPSFLATDDSAGADAGSGFGGGGGGGGAGALGYSEQGAVLGALGGVSASGSAMNVSGGGGGGGGALGTAPGGGGGGAVGGGADYKAQLSGEQVAKYASAAGFTGESLIKAIAISKGESGWSAGAYNPHGRDNSYGLWQINMKNDDPANPGMGTGRLKQFGISANEDLWDPAINAKAAFIVSGGGGNFGPWSVYTKSTYLQHMDAARSAARGAGVAGDAVSNPSGGAISHHHTWNVNVGRGSVQEMERMISEMESRAVGGTARDEQLRR